MSRRFLYVSLGILALSVAYHLGAGQAGADWQPGAEGQVRGITGWGGNTWIAIGPNGELVFLNGSTGWGPTGYPPLPPGVAISDVKFFEGTSGGYTLLDLSRRPWAHLPGRSNAASQSAIRWVAMCWRSRRGDDGNTFGETRCHTASRDPRAGGEF